MFKTLLQKNLILATKGSGKVKKEEMSYLKYELYLLGYKLTGDALKIIPTIENFEEFSFKLLEELRKIKGSNVSYTTLREFLDKKELEIPNYEELPATELNIISYKDALKLGSALLTSKTNLSIVDKDIVINAVSCKDFVFPEKIENKENLALMVAGLSSYSALELSSLLSKYVKTSTDVLRICTIFSGGDVSLSKPCLFKFSNKEKKVITFLLEGIKNPEVDMKRWINRWKKVARAVHFKKDSNAFKALDLIMHSPKNIYSYNRAVEGLDAVKLLKERPGEFARRVDLYLRNGIDVIDEFASVIKDVSSPVLLQMKGNFKLRKKEKERFFLAKIDGKGFLSDKGRKGISSDLLKRINSVLDTELKRRYYTGEKRAIDAKYEDIIVPMNMRNSAGEISRGSRVRIDDAKFLRLFCWWRNCVDGSRVDVDLSGMIFDEYFNSGDYLDYTELDGTIGKHSGDFTDGKDGVSEFIDVDREAILEKGRYLAITLNVFTRQKFSEFECFAGVMQREGISDSVYDARTVDCKFDVNLDRNIYMPFVFDLVENKMIWTDLSLAGGFSCNNIRDGRGGLSKLVKSIVEYKEHRVTMAELLGYYYDIVPEGEDVEVIGMMRLDEMAKLI